MLWYAGADKNVPAAAGRWLADRIPKSRFVLWPHHGHFTWAIGFEAADIVATTAGDVPRMLVFYALACLAVVRFAQRADIGFWLVLAQFALFTKSQLAQGSGMRAT